MKKNVELGMIGTVSNNKYVGIVTYIGKYGYTLTTMHRDFSISFSNPLQLQYIDPDNKVPQTIEELQDMYPEYFI